MVKEETFTNVEYCEPLQGRSTDAKNRVWVGAQVSDALNQKRSVYIIIGERVGDV